MKSKKILISAVLIILLLSGTVSMAFLNEHFGFIADETDIVSTIDDIDISYVNSFSSQENKLRLHNNIKITITIFFILNHPLYLL